MSDRVEVRAGAYADSVRLLQISRELQGLDGVVTAQVAMATPLNLDVLTGMGFDLPEATTNDLLIAVRSDDESVWGRALTVVDELLTWTSPGGVVGQPTASARPRTTASALRDASADALVLISVPGQHAAVEAMDALTAGHDVMVFSDNVPLDHEVALKRFAAERGRLVMGPDCGTAVVGGLGLGFANVCAPGPVGIVAASGTGCQHLMSLLDRAGVGVTHALGVGGRDLTDQVDALATVEALRRLDADPSVELIVVVSKPPGPAVAARVESYADSLTTPVEFALLGADRPDLTQVAERVLERLGLPVPDWSPEGAAGSADGTLLRGLFVGGTLCDEAMLVASAALGPIRSNIPLSPDLRLAADLSADQHWMIDFGDDDLTVGRAHPMIDPTLRLEHVARAAADPSTGVLLLDVVLGHGAEPDPADRLAPALAAVRASRPLPILVTVVGTEQDPQRRSRQVAALVAVGAEVHLSNARAARRAVELIGATR